MGTSASAFAASSLAGFAGSEQSPFGAIGTSTTSIFKKPAETTGDKPATTGFAAAEGPSPFAATGTSGFAGLGTGFGGFAAAGKPGGLTSFASPGGPSVLSSTSKDKPFGAPDEEEEKEDEAAESGPGEFEQDKTDERFFEQESMSNLPFLTALSNKLQQLKLERKKKRHTSRLKRSFSNSPTRSGKSVESEPSR